MAMKDTAFRDSALSEREKKNINVIDVLRKRGPLSRTDIARYTGMNIVTTSHYVNNYIKNSIVHERGYNISTGGRKPMLVELNKKAFCVIGVDVAHAHIIGVITDLGAEVLAKVKRPRPAGMMDDVMTKVIDVVKELIEKSKVDMSKVKGIGVGLSGVIDMSSETVRDTDHTRGATSASYSAIRGRLGKEFNVPTYVGNDATVAAYGERWLGLDNDVENMIYIYSDVGCGIIIKGDIYCGASGSAGEVQLNLDNPDLDRFTCFMKGPCFLKPWGDVDSGISKEAKRRVREGFATKISELAKGNVDNITTQVVIKAAKSGDALALELIENAGINLGIRIAYFINLLNPEIVVIGGGIEEAGDYLLTKVKKVVKGFAFEEPSSLVKILPSRLGEDAVSLGAALLVMREVFATI